MPTYEHICEKCKHEWEEAYSIKASVPTKCPGCSEEGGVKRLISSSSGRVEIEGEYELRKHYKSEAEKAKQRARKDENFLANVIGEDRYHQNRLNESRRERDKY